MATSYSDNNNPQELRQLLVYGVYKGNSGATLEKLLDEPDINCLGLTSLQNSAGSLPDIVAKVAAMPVDALILYASEFDSEMQRFMQGYHDARRGVSTILVITSPIDVELLQTAMQCGINKVVTASGNERKKVCEAVRGEALRNISRSETAAVLKYDSRVVVTYSSKGGSGKTTLAVNLAAALVKRGKKVVIIDLDLASGDVHSFLGVDNSESIAELAEEPQPITPAMIKSYVQHAPTGIGVMCAPNAPQHAVAVQADFVDKVITTLRADNDFVIIDCDHQVINGSIAECVDTAMQAADNILFVVTPEIPTINGAHDMLFKYLDRIPGISEKIRIVVNKVSSASTITPSEISKTLDKPVYAEIPDDYGTVVSTLNTGVPFMTMESIPTLLSFLKKPIIKAFEHITDMLIENR